MSIHSDKENKDIEIDTAVNSEAIKWYQREKAGEKWKDKHVRDRFSDAGAHTQNKWWIELEQQNWKREKRDRAKWKKINSEGKFQTHTRTKNYGDLIQAGGESPECWGCVLQVSGEAGRGLSASDFLSYLSFSSSLMPVTHHLLLLLLPYSTLTTTARFSLKSTTACEAFVWHQFQPVLSCCFSYWNFTQGLYCGRKTVYFVPQRKQAIHFPYFLTSHEGHDLIKDQLIIY